MKKHLISAILAVCLCAACLSGCGQSSKNTSTTPYVPGSFGSGSETKESVTPQSGAKENTEKEIGAAADDNKAPTEKPTDADKSTEYVYLPVSMYYEYGGEETLKQTCTYDSNGVLKEYVAYDSDFGQKVKLHFTAEPTDNTVPPDRLEFYFVMGDTDEFGGAFEFRDYKISAGMITDFALAFHAPEGEPFDGGKITDIKYDSNGALARADVSIAYSEDNNSSYSQAKRSDVNTYTSKVVSSDAAGRPTSRIRTYAYGYTADESFEYDEQGRLRLYTYEELDWVYEFIFDENGCLTSQSCAHTLSGNRSTCTYEYQAFPAKSFKGAVIDYATLAEQEDKTSVDQLVIACQIPKIIRMSWLNEYDDSFEYLEYQG